MFLNAEDVEFYAENCRVAAIILIKHQDRKNDWRIHH